jgi:hypothetical protein
MSNDHLFMALGHGADLARGNDEKLNDQNFRGTSGAALGKRIFSRWNSALHEFLCKPGKADRAIRDRILGAFSGRSGGLTALIAVLISHFAVPASTAVIVATLIIRIIGEPAQEEICEAWHTSLKSSKAPRMAKKKRKGSTS